MKYDGRIHGRTSQQNPIDQSLKDQWEIARSLNAQGGEGEWVPARAIFRRDEILPRHEGEVNWDKVKEYAEIFRDLPPIHVQQGTFVLIDGNHRLHAAFEQAATTDHIRIIEIDVVTEEELRTAAWEANAMHGVAYTRRDRMERAEYLITTTEWADGEIARHCGMARTNVLKIRHRLEGRPEPRETPQPQSEHPVMSESVKSDTANLSAKDEVDRTDVRPVVTVTPDEMDAITSYVDHVRAAASVRDETIMALAASGKSSEVRWYLETLIDHKRMLAEASK